ncbi:MAG: protein kinase [Anaerolineales bacterium]|nr:protein kinase [Anaerolineales bacterium]
MLTQVGRYQIIKKIGQGGMAIVYLAKDPEIGREVAIKVLTPQGPESDELRARFHQEAQTIASLDHPWIVPIYDYGEVNGAPYLVMRHMAGGSLADWLRRGPLPLPTIQEIMRRLAGALDEAHSRGIVHRDIKPANILFDQRQAAFLSDFGIVKRLNASVNLTQAMGVVGTPAYMSPEQARGGIELDGRSDIYSLGIVLFEMLTGQRPFQAPDTPALLHAQVYEAVPPLRQFNPYLPPACQPVVETAMAKDREQRFASAGALVDALEPIAAAAPPTDYVPPASSYAAMPPTGTAVPGLSTTERLKRQIKRLPVWARLAILSLALVPLVFILIRAFAAPPPVAATRLATDLPPATLTATATATETPSATPVPLGTLILLAQDDSAIWRRDGEPVRIPDDGLIPLYAGQPVTIQANALPVEMVLPDRTKLFLDKASSLQIDPVDAALALTLTAGRLVAAPANQPARIAAPSGFYAAAPSGFVGVAYDPTTGSFAVDCLEDACALVISEAQRIDMAQGEARLVENNVLVNPDGARYEAYRDLASGLPTPTPRILMPDATPSPTATSTRTPAPLATMSGEAVQSGEIGRSVNGRSLEAVRLGNGPRHIILVGGTHAGYAPNSVQLAN